MLLAHDDAISQLSMRENLLVSSSWDSTVKVSFMPSRAISSRRHPVFELSMHACMHPSICNHIL